MGKTRLILTYVIVVLLLTSVLATLSYAQTSDENIRVKVISYLEPQKAIENILSQAHLLYFVIGKFYYNTGNYDKAKGLFEKTIGLNREFAPAYHNLGVMAYEQNNYQEAVNYFKESIEVDENYVKGHYSLGIFYFQVGRFEDSIVNFERAVLLEPDNANYNYDLGQSYVAKFRQAENIGEENYTDLEMALLYLKKAITLNEYDDNEDRKEKDENLPNLSGNIVIIESIIDARHTLLNWSST